jgi:hypothetical protein
MRHIFGYLNLYNLIRSDDFTEKCYHTIGKQGSISDRLAQAPNV